ncbi:sigma-54 dependent transcriptional regulator [Desulfitobacterium sp. THU1]|uniref:sigma-54-dependent transcriptional regulator n=1 Tax=Desulfitobacterium sp. THU1 TaxID=3138072 RepID=UPI00311E48C5
MKKVLVVDDEANMRWALEKALLKEGYEVLTAANGQTALDAILSERPDLVLLDFKMSKVNGIEVLREITSFTPQLIVIMMTAHGNTAIAVEAMKLGAYDYIMKPFDIDELLLTVEKAFELRDLRQQVNSPKQEVMEQQGWEQMVGQSAPMRSVLNLVKRVAPTSATVLLQGESGTGKELVAHAIYSLSSRWEGPLIRVNCAALPESLMESELFGHEKGAFTGAHARKAGRFELADGGTLFLDEIGELSLGVQAKLLRVLQERTFERVGGVKTLKVDVRIIAATNKDLLEEIKDGRFREDLFYRLSVFPINLPPLRERIEDIPLLAQHFLEKLSLNGETKRFREEVIERFKHYDWPGNVRELQNIIERMVILCPYQEIGVEWIPDLFMKGTQGKGAQAFTLPSEGISLEELEKTLLEQALERADGNQTHAAQLLGLSRHAYLYRLEKYGIDRKNRR